MAERVGNAVAERGVGFSPLGLAPREEQTLLAPELPPDSGKSVGEGRARLAVPSVDTDGRAGATVEACRKQGHDREQREQAGRRAGNRPIRPLALGLDAEMVAHFAEGDFHLPALDEPADDLQRLASGIGAQQGLRVEAMLRIAQQHPTDRQDWQASMAPDRGGGIDLDDPIALAVPAGYGDPYPGRVPGGQDLGEVRQACTLGAWPPDRPGSVRRRR